MTGMDGTEPKRRWFYPTPDWLVIGLLVVEFLLWLSNWLGWPSWHKGYAVLASIAAVGQVLVLMFLWLIIALVVRWRFQFSIRSLLVLVVAVAMPFSWLAVEIKRANEQRGLMAEIVGWGGRFYYDWYFRTTGPLLWNKQPPEPLWLREPLGDDFFSVVRIVDLTWTNVGDKELERLKGLMQMKELAVDHSQVTAAGIKRLQQALPNCQIFRSSDLSGVDQ